MEDKNENNIISNPFTSLKKKNTGKKSQVCEVEFLKLIQKHAESFRNFGKMLPLNHAIISEFEETLKVSRKGIFQKIKEYVEIKIFSETHHEKIPDTSDDSDVVCDDDIKNQSGQNPKFKVISAIKTAAYTAPYSNYIQQILILPVLNVKYYSKIQIEYFNQHLKKRKEYNCINIDVSKCSSFFAYQVLLNTDTVVVPITQMICEKNESKIVHGWLSDVSEIISSPKEIIIDQSEALLLTVVQLFTQFDSVNDYLNCCHKIIDDESDVEQPSCFIRHDIVNIVINLKKNKIFEKMDSRVKRFYLLCIGVLFKVEHFTDLKNVVKDILCLSISQFETSSTENARRRLTELIRTHNVSEIVYPENENKDSDDSDNEITDGELSPPTNCENLGKIMNWYYSLQKSVQNSTEDDVGTEKDNLYFVPEFEDWFEKFIYKMPTWSAIMRLSFGSPNLNVCSSNYDEFTNIKRFLFKSEKNIRADQFLFSNIKDIIERMRLMFANKQKSTRISKI